MPARSPYIPDWGNDFFPIWGDHDGNRSERFRDVIAYVDGQRPSLVTARGDYARIARDAWDFRDGRLVHRWSFDSNAPGNSSYNNTVIQQIKVADVDNDGRQEIINGSSAIDDDGTGLWAAASTAVSGGNGDALHVGDLLPDRPGLEEWMCLDSPDSTNSGYGYQLRDARTGAFIWGVPVGGDTSRGVAAPIDPTRKGYQFWGALTSGLYDVAGSKISSTLPGLSFVIWWDADNSREILSNNVVTQWNGSSLSTIFTASGYKSVNGTKTTPVIQADILGDLREEFVLTNGTNRLRIYTPTERANDRLYTLMHDPQYRAQVAIQNSGSNQAPNPGFYLGTNMGAQPPANINYANTPVSNYAPSAWITSPQTGDNFQPGSSIAINAYALDGDGNISRVDFYRGSTLLGSDTTAPYSFTWSGAPVGSYSITAVAVDSTGATTTSSSADITVSTQPILLSQNKPATASSVQTGNDVGRANDGDLSTRWTAAAGTYPQWWRVDLGAVYDLRKVAINWNGGNARSYKYRIEASNDDVNYAAVVDQTGRTTTGELTSDQFTASGRYVRVTVTGTNDAGFAAFFECKVFGSMGSTPNLPPTVSITSPSTS